MSPSKMLIGTLALTPSLFLKADGIYFFKGLEQKTLQ